LPRRGHAGKLEVDSQIALSVPVPGRILGITASRGGADFDERDLQLFNALRPFLAATLQNISERARIAATLAALAVASNAPEAILLADRLGAVEAADERSERWLATRRTTQPQLIAELEGFLRSSIAGGSRDLRAASVRNELLVEDPAGRERADGRAPSRAHLRASRGDDEDSGRARHRGSPAHGLRRTQNADGAGWSFSLR
jgi:hypothetical protein